MAQLEVTWARSFRIWWALFWRFSLLSLAGGTVVMLMSLVLLMTTDMTVAQLEPIHRSPWMQSLYYVIGLASSVIATKAALRSEWTDFRISLLPRAAQQVE